MGSLKEDAMSENFELIDSFVSEVKRNTDFLGKMLFPRIIVMVLGIGGILIAISLLVK
jgi:hypothetical protein